MHKVIYFFILIFTITSSSITSFSQKILYDIKDNNGERKIRTENTKQKIANSNYYFSLQVYENNNDLNFYLIVQSKTSIPENSTILLKLDNNEVITLEMNNLNTKDFTSTYNLPIYNVNGNTNFILSQNETLYSALYNIDIKTIQKFINQRIIKIRIPTADKSIYNEKDLNNNKIGSHITNSYLKLIQTLNNKTDHRSFNSDKF